MKYLKCLIIVNLLTFLSCSKNSNEDNRDEIEKINAAPKTFSLLEIKNNTLNVSLKPSFNWQVAIDPEGDVVTYDFIMDTNSSPTTTIGSDLSQPKFDILSELEINTQYYWKVIAKDVSMNVTESQVFSFVTISQLPNEAPENFNLLTIEDNSLDVPLNPTFTWEEAIDPEGGPISYDFYLDTEAEPVMKLGSNLEQPSFTIVTSLDYETIYYWKVVAKDDNENLTITQTYSFATRQDYSAIDVPFAVVDEVPVFPGCENVEDKRNCFSENIIQHVNDHLNYPIEAENEGIEGRVNCIFTVSTTGTIKNIRVSGPHISLENEALRVLNLLPEMLPGKENGQNVNVQFAFPITFKL